jgi:hypothetical protein
MKEALKELRKIVATPDQKYWKPTEMRERALEDWVDKWIVVFEEEQMVLNQRFMTSDFEDFLKEQIGKKLSEKALEESIEIEKEKNKIRGKMVCFRKIPR